MALIAACTLEPGVYLSMNMKGEPAATAAKVTAMGFPVTVEHMDELADQIGEHTLFGRTGGAPTLAVGMAQIFSTLAKGRFLDFWYHFAIMFEALFILTTIDAGTRVGRYILQDALGHLWKPLGRTSSLQANLVASLLMVGGWGYFLIQGVLDPLGGIKSLWPLFGIANQMLAAIALCLATTILLKMAILSPRPGQPAPNPLLPLPLSRRFALVTLLPLVWLLSVTITAGVQKVWHSEPTIGFLAQARSLADRQPELNARVLQAQTAVDPPALRAAEKAARENRVLRFNNLLDAAVAVIFMSLVVAVVTLSLREWWLLLSGRKKAVLHETPPVWLPDYAVAERSPVAALGVAGLTVALARELSGEAYLERAVSVQPAVATCSHGRPQARVGHRAIESRAERQRVYLAATEERFRGVRRCC
jgi:carbon starvation protein